jgi:NAD(P)-dependent dehydrogenase (short-subunit alcohol dehydrogenase family)
VYPVPDQTGRTIVVTGANSGTGREAAKRLTAAGAHVILAVRNPEKGAEALVEILGTRPDARAEVRVVDLADLASVRAFAAGLGRDLDRLDTLVNNAGVMVPPRRHETADGHELQWGTNFLGHFALTNLLLPLLLAAPAPRVATMSSGAANLAPEGTGSILFAATDLAALPGAYYGPRYLIRGEPHRAGLTRRMRDAATAARLWSVAEDTTSTAPPAR